MATEHVFLPKALTCLGDTPRRQLARDVLAGLTVGVVALPLALAFGIASIPESVAREVGLSPPVMGLYTAIVAGFLISALGGTRTSIGGPTGAFVVIVYAIAAQHGYAGLVLATMMAGLLLIGFGLARLGSMIKFIPYPVTTGFTSGIAVIIFTAQMRDLLGLQATDLADAVPPSFLGKLSWYATHVATIEWTTAAVGLASVALLLLWPRFVTRRVPAPIAVLLLATAANRFLHLGMETVEGRFGAIPTGLPVPRLPSIDLSQVGDLVVPAFTIAVLAGIESLLCAVVADGMLGSRHRSNTELVAQGIANVASPLFGGIPATGAIARTATNVQAGGRTPVSGMVHALTLLAILLALGRLAGHVPLAVLAAVLVIVAWNMSEARRFRWLLSGPRSDAAVLLTTFGLTVLTDLTIAVQAGMILAALLFIKRMADITNVSAIRTGAANGGDVPLEQLDAHQRSEAEGAQVYDINGPFFFGAAFKLRDTLDSISRPPRTLVLNLTNVPAMDATGLHALDEIRRRCLRTHTRVILVGVHAQPMVAMERSGLLEQFGKDNLAGSVEEALRMAAAPAAESAGETTERRSPERSE